MFGQDSGHGGIDRTHCQSVVCSNKISTRAQVRRRYRTSSSVSKASFPASINRAVPFGHFTLRVNDGLQQLLRGHPFADILQIWTCFTTITPNGMTSLALGGPVRK